jgi:serine/threonine protein kinase
LAYNGTNQQEIVNEAEAVALLCTKGHPNIVEVVAHGHLSMVNYYIDMELCDLSLAELFKRKPKGEGLQDWYLQWPIETVNDRIFFTIALMQELANGLYFIHKHDRVHRDIKPENSTTLPLVAISDFLF